MTLPHTLEILLVLKEAAKEQKDPKPALEQCKTDQMTEWMAFRLIEAIEANYSQVKALEDLGSEKIITLKDNQIQILRNAEMCGQLFEGYSVVITEIEEEIDSRKATKNCETYFQGPTEVTLTKDLGELLRKIRDKAEKIEGVETLKAAVRKSATGQHICGAVVDLQNSSKLGQFLPALIAAIKQDKETIATKVKAGNTREEISKKAQEIKLASEKIALQTKNKVEELSKQVNWKFVAAGLAGIVLGAAIAKKK